MNKLEQLIKELCPNGVEYAEIGSVVNYEQPTKYIVDSTDYDDNYEIPVLTAGQKFILGYTDETNGIFNASKEKPVIIFDDFTGAFKWVDFPFKVKSSAMKILTADENKAMPRYIYHIMGHIGFSSSEHKRLWIGIYSAFQIPVPPLEVQAEIVKVLDEYTENVTALQQELEKELTARKKQYEYYRDRLLSFNENDCEWRTLGEVCLCQSGGTPSTKTPEYWGGDIKWLASTVCNNTKTVKEVTKYITEAGAKKSRIMKPKTTLIALVGATIGKTAFLPYEAAINQNIVGIYPIDEKILMPDFVYYYCSRYYNKFMELSSGKLAMANMTFVRGLLFPIILIEKQKRIVSILDRFDKLCNDISEGLPAEIEARRKQYEYYRDKLLSFEEVKK